MTLIGEDIALDTDPNAQRYADWGIAVWQGNREHDNTFEGATIVTRGSRTDSYGLERRVRQRGFPRPSNPTLAHRKAAGFVVDNAVNAVVNNLDLTMHTFGHGFFTGS